MPSSSSSNIKGIYNRSLVRVPGSGGSNPSEALIYDLSRVSSLAATVRVSTVLPPALNGDGSAASAVTSSQKIVDNNREMSTTSVDNNTTSTTTTAPVPINPTSSDNTTPIATAPVPKNPTSDDNATSTATAAAPVPKNPTSGDNATSTATAAAPVLPGNLRKRPFHHVRQNGSTNIATNTSTSALPAAALPAKRFKMQPRVIYMTPQQLAQHSSNLIEIDTQKGPLFLLPLPSHPQVGNEPPSFPPSVCLTQLLQERESLILERNTLRTRVSLFQQLFRNREKLLSVCERLGVFPARGA